MKNMSYEEFKKRLLGMLRERLRDSIKSEIIPVNKNNGIMKETVGIENGIDGLKPLVYVESLYDQYCIGADLSTWCQLCSRTLPCYARLAYGAVF